MNRIEALKSWKFLSRLGLVTVGIVTAVNLWPKDGCSEVPIMLVPREGGLEAVALYLDGNLDPERLIGCALKRPDEHDMDGDGNMRESLEGAVGAGRRMLEKEMKMTLRVVGGLDEVRVVKMGMPRSVFEQNERWGIEERARKKAALGGCLAAGLVTAAAGAVGAFLGGNATDAIVRKIRRGCRRG